MIKAVIQTDTVNILLMGVTPGNIERLQAGEPILVKSEEVGIPFEVVLLHGKNNEALVREFEKFGIKQENAQKVVDNRCSDPNCRDCGNG